ncbi:MAG: hypothetical protein R3B48_26355 [Kofleriaceae bacterium]
MRSTVLCCLLLAGCAFEGTRAGEGEPEDTTGNGSAAPPATVQAEIRSPATDGDLFATFVAADYPLSADNPCTPLNQRFYRANSANKIEVGEVPVGQHRILFFRLASSRGVPLNIEWTLRNVSVTETAGANVGVVSLPAPVSAARTKDRVSWATPVSFEPNAYLLGQNVHPCAVGSPLTVSGDQVSATGRSVIKIVLENAEQSQMAIGLSLSR